MKLDQYLAINGLTDDAFAQTLGVAHRLTVNRYRRGLRVPRPSIMRRIAEVTGGQVTANDFIETEGTQA